MIESLRKRFSSSAATRSGAALRGRPGTVGERIISALPWLLTGWLMLWLVLAPLPFASVTVGWSTLLRLAAFVALAMALATAEAPRRPAPVLRIAAVGCLLAVLGLAQSLPLPSGLVEALSPAHAAQAAATGRILGPDVPVASSLSLDPEASRRAALGWLAAVAALLAAAVAGRSPRRRSLLFGAVLVTAFLEVFFGARRLFAESTEIWGVEVAGLGSRLRGTFVNADHLALYLEIALAVALASAYASFRRAARQSSPERKIVEVVPPTICWLVLFVGLSFTGSRAGVAAALLATVAQGLLLAAARRNWRLAPAAVGAALLGIGAAAWFGMQQGLGRLLATSSYEIAWNARPLIYEASIELWRSYPLLGTGLGSFAAAFPLVQPEPIAGAVWTHAHNGWLEMLVTTGVVGFCLLLAGVWLLLRELRRVLQDSLSTASRAAALAALGAAAAVSLHELLDFGITMPANAFTLAVVLGAALGALRDYDSEEARLIGPGVNRRRSAERSSSSEGSAAMAKSTRSGRPG